MRDTGKPIILYGRLYTKYETIISEIDTFVDAKEDSIVSEGNEVLVPASGETAEDIARAAVVKSAEIILGGDLNIIKPHPELVSSFLAITISNGTQQKELSKRAQGKSVVHIHNSDLKEVIFSYPSTYEQTAISKFFHTLDDTITLHQRKLDGLKELKQGYLQKMFPQPGESEPRVRFAGFTGAWEKRKLGDVAEITFGGGTPTTTNDEFWNGHIPWLRSSDLTEHDVRRVNLRKSITQKGLDGSATKLIPSNSIAIVTRVGVGKLSLVPFQYATSQDFLSLSKLNIDIWFGVYAIYKKMCAELEAVQGTSIKGITKDELLSKEISAPIDKNEQTTIGNFFQNIDEQISIQEQKVNQLRRLKSAYLQKMFI